MNENSFLLFWDKGPLHKFGILKIKKPWDMVFSG